MGFQKGFVRFYKGPCILYIVVLQGQELQLGLLAKLDLKHLQLNPQNVGAQFQSPKLQISLDYNLRFTPSPHPRSAGHLRRTGRMPAAAATPGGQGWGGGGDTSNPYYSLNVVKGLGGCFS